MASLPAPKCELDQWALAEAARRQRAGEPVSALLIGVGAENQALRMAESGVRVLLLSAHADLAHPNIQQLPPQLPQDSGPPLPLEPFDLILCQRAMNGMRYVEARARTYALLRRLRIGGKLFISFYGIHSELGDHYPDGGKLVGERFCEVPAELAQRYGISGPICLYSERNIFSLLMEAGGAILRTSTSALGHVRGVAARI